MDFSTCLIFPRTLFWAFLIAVYAVSISAYADDMAEITSLEKQFHKLSNDIYSAFAKNLDKCQVKVKSLNELKNHIKNLKTQHNEVIGICLIHKNASLIRKNIDNKEIFYIFRYLLNNNDFILANTLYTTVKNEGDKSLISNISYIFARYYAQRREWKKVSQVVAGIYSDLSFENANYTRLIAGIALQKEKAHRKAVTIYSKISKKSRYYPASQLNIATAYLRQDWWTDAQLKINSLLNNKSIHLSNEMVNRLYLVSGYSLLRKEYYRDAREAFRNIEINSIYSNRALLGIALTATSQEDFISALNAINILKRKKIHDLTVDESYLLLPYIYEKLKQNMTASASYTDALNYYKRKIDKIKMTQPATLTGINANDIINNNYKLIINNSRLSFEDNYPLSFLYNSKNISEISKQIIHIKNHSLKNSFDKLKVKYSNLLSKLINNMLFQYSKRLNNYMNQSRFGIARLYDSTRSTNE